MKRKYESMFILPPIEDEKVKENIEKVKNFITKKEGEILEVKEWGKRKLAYEIDHYNEGYYVIILFNLDANHISSLENFYKLNENIIRFIVIKQDK
ncbi:MAG: 30S ribosomal protein S6 [Candidatus Cloacimonetes bacterium]|nr:30S ribosomal protein S6 [Candidatus Cloacimonadota bacterium]